MEPKAVGRTITKFQLNLPSDVRARLEEYVASATARFYPAKLTMTDVVNAAIVEYLDQRQAEERAA